MSARHEESVHAPIRTQDGSSEDAALESAVKSAIASHGPSLLFDAGSLRQILQREVPGRPRAIELLLEAQTLDVPQRLLGAHTGTDVEATIASLAAYLVDTGPMPAADAQWAVARWARILGVVGESAPAATPVVGSDVEPLAPIGLGVDGRAVRSDGRGALAEIGAAREAMSRARPLTLTAFAAALAFAMLLGFNFLRPTLDITAITSADKLVADGTPHDVTVAFKTHRATVRSIEVQAVGSGSEEPPKTIAVASAGTFDGQVSAGTIALLSEQPRALTYRYVLVGNDGARSPPFEKTFEFAAEPLRPPVITTVTAPPDLVADKPFALAIAYEPGTHGIAQVEMQVVSSTFPWTSKVVTLPWVTPASDAADVIRYPFESGLRPSLTTLAFTMIDQDGVRSRPQRIVLDVRKPAGSDSRKPGILAGCTRTTCGRIVATHEIEPSQGLVGFIRRIFVKDDPRPRKLYEVVVRRDDGTTHSLNDTTRWHVGARVRIVGNRVSLRCLDAADRCT